MTLLSYRMDRIYLATIMGYCLGSIDPKEPSNYNRLRNEMDVMKKDSIKKVYLLIEISQMEWIDKHEYFFIN